jgi:hypothetical protein
MNHTRQLQYMYDTLLILQLNIRHRYTGIKCLRSSAKHSSHNILNIGANIVINDGYPVGNIFNFLINTEIATLSLDLARFIKVVVRLLLEMDELNTFVTNVNPLSTLELLKLHLYVFEIETL